MSRLADIKRMTNVLGTYSASCHHLTSLRIPTTPDFPTLLYSTSRWSSSTNVYFCVCPNIITLSGNKKGYHHGRRFSSSMINDQSPFAKQTNPFSIERPLLSSDRKMPRIRLCSRQMKMGIEATCKASYTTYNLNTFTTEPFEKRKYSLNILFSLIEESKILILSAAIFLYV